MSFFRGTIPFSKQGRLRAKRLMLQPSGSQTLPLKLKNILFAIFIVGAFYLIETDGTALRKGEKLSPLQRSIFLVFDWEMQIQ